MIYFSVIGGFPDRRVTWSFECRWFREVAARAGVGLSDGTSIVIADEVLVGPDFQLRNVSGLKNFEVSLYSKR